METTTKKTFTELRNIVAKIHKSILEGYLDENYKDIEIIVLTNSGYYANIDDCVEIDGDYLHTELDSDEYVIDELTESYIFESDSICVNNGRTEYYTHKRNLRGGDFTIDIYQYCGEYIDQLYIERNNLVFDFDGRLRDIDDVYYWESDGEYHDEPEIETGLIEPYSYKPRPNYFMSANESFKDSPLFMGIELEIENEDENITNGELSRKLENRFLYFKSDGSLDNGFEIVSHPLSFSWIQENKSEFVDMLERIKNNGFRSYDSTTCGMHIHLSKKNFGAWHLYRFLKFFQENKQFIVAISQRNIDNLKQWANLEDETNDSLIYKAKKKEGYSRYVAVNLCNSHTIELRIFRGTLNQNSFFKNIEFAHSVYLFSRDYTDMTISAYKKFLTDNPSYSHLNKFIKLKNL
jgi:hypothetical protein